MKAFELSSLLAERRQSAHSYLEFLRVPALSAGIYVLPVAGEDAQRPHQEDEVYYVLSGRASIRVGDGDRAVGPGSIIFVAAGIPHRFHDITEELTILVFFAPAETA
jgi:mannose-6-phosphate isomerase-like protein (cupin superfamily)